MESQSSLVKQGNVAHAHKATTTCDGLRHQGFIAKDVDRIVLLYNCVGEIQEWMMLRVRRTEKDSIRQKQLEEESLSGSYGGDPDRIRDTSRLEYKICWYVYDPAAGDEYWQISQGTPFSELPQHWTCPQRDGKKDEIMVLVDPP